jgi:hypothetical protein
MCVMNYHNHCLGAGSPGPAAGEPLAIAVFLVAVGVSGHNGTNNIVTNTITGWAQFYRLSNP